MLNVEITMVWRRVRVCRLMLVRLLIANQNVLSIQTVRVTEHVSQKNAEIHAKVLVDCLQNVSLTTTYRSAYVQKDLLAILLDSAYNDPLRVCTYDLY